MGYNTRDRQRSSRDRQRMGYNGRGRQRMGYTTRDRQRMGYNTRDRQRIQQTEDGINRKGSRDLRIK
eukprot:1128651-Amorphochlora_amoeboformis.AAC.1